jgi:hypothetical protein
MAKRLFSNIQLLAVPSKDTDLVNVKYVKDLISRKIKEPVKVVSLENIDATYDPLTKTLTERTGSALKVDTIELAVGDRVLVAGQLDQSTNGIYVVDTIGTDTTPAKALMITSITNPDIVTFTEADFLATNSADVTLTYNDTNTAWEDGTGSAVTLADYGITVDGSFVLSGGETITITYTAPVTGTSTVLKRAEDFDESSEISPNVLIPVSQGSNADMLFMLVNDNSITLDTDALIFAKYTCNQNNATKYVGTFQGDGSTTEWTIQHAMNDKNIVLTFYDETGCPCYFDYELTSENVITVKSDIVLDGSEGEFTVIVIG